MPFAILFCLLLLHMVILYATYPSVNPVFMTFVCAVHSFVTAAISITVALWMTGKDMDGWLLNGLTVLYMGYWYYIYSTPTVNTKFKSQNIEENFAGEKMPIPIQPKQNYAKNGRFTPASQQKRWVPVKK